MRPWTARVVLQLAVLSAAGFSYVTAELLPIAALTAIAADLGVGEGWIGSLLAVYALVAALATVPLVRLTARWPRRRVLLLTLICLTASQALSALAPNFTVLVAGRMLCASTHGLMWSVVAPIGARLVPATHTGRATAVVYLGTGVALVVGNPMTAAIGQLWGWRPAVAALAAFAAAVTVAAWRLLPLMPDGRSLIARVAHHRNDRLLTLSGLTLIGVTAHFVSYTFIVVIIRDVVGVAGPPVAWLLAGYGVAGLVGLALLARRFDRRPRAAVISSLTVLLIAFGTLTFFAMTGRTTSVISGAAIVLWGFAVTALAPMLQTTVMRSAPDDPDGASGLYVVAFQIGIMVGALSGGLLYQRDGLYAVVLVSTLLSASVLAAVLRNQALLRPSMPVALDLLPSSRV